MDKQSNVFVIFEVHAASTKEFVLINKLRPRQLPTVAFVAVGAANVIAQKNEIQKSDAKHFLPTEPKQRLNIVHVFQLEFRF